MRAVLLSTLLFVPAFARAQSADDAVARARGLYEGAEFEAARDAFEAIAARSEGAALADASRYLVALELILGDEAAAREHARRAVAADPGVVAPPGAPPEASSLIDEARADIAPAAPRGPPGVGSPGAMEPSAPILPAPTPAPSPPEDDGGASAWPFVAAGALALGVLAVVIVLVATGSEQDGALVDDITLDR